MKKTTRGLLSLLLTLALVFGVIGVMPITAQAATATALTIAGSLYDDIDLAVPIDNIVTEGWGWDGNNTLTLGGNYGGRSIAITAVGTVNLVLTGDVTIIGMPTAITCTGGKLVIKAGIHKLTLDRKSVV